MSPHALAVVSVDPDRPAFTAWCEVLTASSLHERPGDPARPASDHIALARQLLAAGGSRSGTHRAAVLDGRVVGALRMILPLRDNLTTALLDVAVHPRHRREGIGTALLAEGVNLARTHRRTALLSEVDEPAPNPGLSRGIVRLFVSLN